MPRSLSPSGAERMRRLSKPAALRASYAAAGGPCCPQTCRGPVAPVDTARHTAGGDQLLAVPNDRAYLGAVDLQVGGLQWLGLPAANQISQHLRPEGEH